MEVAFVLLAAITCLIELAIARRWLPAYWNNGIIFFRARCMALNPRTALPRPTTLELRFMDTQWPTLDFAQLEGDRIAFKENYKGSRFAYTQLMRGYVSFEKETGSVEVVGLLNYFALLFTLATIAYGVADGTASGAVFTAFGLLVLGACYAIQAKRYNEVLSAAAAEWGQPPLGTGATQ